MERLFSPCTRLFDHLQSQIGTEVLQELNVQELNLDVSTEEFLSAERAFTYADLYAVLGNGETVAWLTPHASVMRTYCRAEDSWMQLHTWRRFCFHVDGERISALACSPEHLLEICDVVLRLLAASVVHSVNLNKGNCRDDDASINALVLALLMEQCQSLKVLKLECLALDENHCRVLGAYSRSGLKIELNSCKLTSAGASALAEILARNQGPTKLHWCRSNIDYSVFADGLRGNSRLKSFRQELFGDFPLCNRQILAIADAVRENKGLVELSLRCFGAIAMNEETWGAVCDSLKMHPALEVLDIRRISNTRPLPDVVTSRVQALVDMMNVNTSIHTIHVDYHYSEHEIYRKSVIPCLETNRFRPLLLAIQKTRPIAYRAKVLGRALLAARTDANRFWMLLSGNAEVAFPSRTTSIVAAANLPTPATTAATSTANVAAVVAFEIPALATTATGSFPTAAAAATSAATLFTASAPIVAAAANVATLSAGQKCKACP
jgi:hypothetical protein